MTELNEVVGQHAIAWQYPAKLGMYVVKLRQVIAKSTTLGGHRWLATCYYREQEVCRATVLSTDCKKLHNGMYTLPLHNE